MNKPITQAPGAGLPFLQKLLVRFILGPFASKRSTWSENRAQYERVTSKIIEMIKQVPSEKRNIKILVPPTRGLEDSSRNWSLDNTLEHLLVVSKGIESLILGLASGVKPGLEVDIAKFKPRGQGSNVLQEFESYAPSLMQSLDTKLEGPAMNKDAKLKHYHPWFGPITAKQWYWLLAMHQGIHYVQIKKIIRGL